MKRKLFLLLCAVLTSVGMWAQLDVTSTYLTNAAVANPTGWTNGATANDANWTGCPENVCLNHGWSTNATDMYQRVTLPKGMYILTAMTRGHADVSSNVYALDVAASKNLASIEVAKNGDSGANNGWAEKSIGFSLDAEKSVQIGWWCAKTTQVWANADYFKLYSVKDVTSKYLTNADFSSTTAITGEYLYGYGKDGTPYGFQSIDGWTSVVTAGDNSTPAYPNSGMAAAVFSYGSSTQLKGNGKAAPSTNPDGGSTGKCFGFFGVWSCGGYYYQDVTLAPGIYTIIVPMYNQSGTQANTTYTGFFPTSGTSSTVAVNSTVGSWQTQTVSFTLEEETEGQIRIGYQSTGNGSGSNPHIFIDRVQIGYVDPSLATARTALLNKINEANTAYNDGANVGTGVFQVPEAAGTTFSAAITAAQEVFDDDDATLSEVNEETSTLNTAIETYQATELNAPDAEKRYCFIVATTGHAKEGQAFGIAPGTPSDNNPTGYTISTVNTTNQSVAFIQVSGNRYNISFETAEGTTYLTYGTTNGSAAGWSDSQIQATTDATKKGEFEIIATSTAHKFNINNILTSSTIACQPGTGNIYTESGNADFTLVEATAAYMAVNATAKWGTFCAPFAVIIPDGVDAYTCADATNGVLNLVEVTTTIPANTPVILNAESGLASTTFYGKKVDNESDDLIAGGQLRGNVSNSAKDIDYTGNEYLLQRKNDKTGFYKMNNENTYKVGYNRCYLVMDSNQGGNAREVFFFEDDATAISALEAAKAETGALKDGKYLIGNKVVIVKNGVKYGASGQKLN